LKKSQFVDGGNVETGRMEGGSMEVFNNLSFSEKCDILSKYGQYITTTIYFHYIVKLYSWDRFFIEVYYDSEEADITRITIAEEQNMIKHLEGITLREIKNLPGIQNPDLL
jgi:hypothetical protein